MIEVSHPTSIIAGNIHISGSKSESNRWLILNAIATTPLVIHNLSNAKDTQVLQEALTSKSQNIDVGHAGTAMRFLTAYYATQPHAQVQLTGSQRMQKRPIGPLVDALRVLGADITYAQKEGFPPLIIKGKRLTLDTVEIRADVSSQYITALMLVAPSLPHGLKINFKEPLTSRPYVEMTKAQLASMGVEVIWEGDSIHIKPQKKWKPQEVFVESDWSSASYWYSMVALSHQAQISLGVYQQDSWQGDAVLKNIYRDYFGVQTIFQQNKIHLSKIKDFILPQIIHLNLNNSPDIAQTIIITCVGLGVKAHLTGLHTLKVKETDRLVALKKELHKIGVEVSITNDVIEILSFKSRGYIQPIETYEDHRMAMSFAPLGLKFPLQILNENVVEKSYPSFWQDLEKVGFKINNL